MYLARQVIFVLTAVLGVALVVVGASGGVWPLSLQLVCGIALLLVTALRLWAAHRS